MIEYLFAYGFLKRKYAMNPDYNVPHMPVNYIGNGYLKGHLFLVDPYPGFIYGEQEASMVKGEVYEVRDQPDFFNNMDQYECALPGYKGPHEYIRRKREVIFEKSTITCWVYEYDLPIDNLVKIESGEF